MKLKYQFFVALLLASALLVAMMAGFARWSFDRGFLEYIQQAERQRLQPLSEALADGFDANGDWQWVTRDDQAAWRALLVEHVVGRRRGRGPRERRRADSLLPDGRLENPSERRPPAPPPRREPPAPDAGLLTLDPRLLLADADRRVLIGRADGSRAVNWQPITLDDEVVGHLGYRAVKTPPGSIDDVFAGQQRRGLVYAALAMVGLSALLAIVVAGRLVRPLLRVGDAVQRIGQGDYEHRVPITRRDEIGDLARDINRLAATLQTSLQSRRRWLAEISHELRTPVAILRGELEALQDGVQTLDQAAVASLHAESLRLNRLIDDLHALTLSDAGALDYRFESVDLGALFDERLDVDRSQAREHGIDVELHAESRPLVVRADRQRIEQLVDNLLQNSLRYTDRGGLIRVTLARADGRVTIDWSDSAPGVDAVHLSKLFDPLYRVDASRERDTGGAGLGLAIVARIVEAHDGTVAAQASSLGGLTIRIDLPERSGAAA